MVLLFAAVCLIVGILIFLMFLVLKRTVRIVNAQTKSYFVNKLQGYDDLIESKEQKLHEIQEQIRDKEKRINEEETDPVVNTGYAFDTNVIDLFNETKYQDKSILELNKKIDENFVVNYEELIKDFLTLCNDNKDYDFCVNLRGKFSSDIIYKLKSMMPSDRESELKNILDNKEYKVYEAFKLMTVENTIDNFIDYLDQLVDLNDPKVKILVGQKQENYDHLSDYIETIYNEKIYRGIKIVYRRKIYDFSLSERNV